ncbi:MAG: hypothetical protein Q8R37_04545 [Nanoarchaeota archaeon]|nr:hypothetical protein [Nanoarchaeota archaeon]
MDIRKTRTCEQCSAVVTLDKVKLYPKNEEENILVCEPCCNEIKKKRSGEIADSKAKTPSPPNYTGYSCTRCNYRFRADRSKAGLIHNLMCPYCGKNDRLEKKK